MTYAKLAHMGIRENRSLLAQQLNKGPLALLGRSSGIDLIYPGAGQQLTEELGAKPPLEVVFYQ